MYSISSKLNSPFSTIGKATADKITATRLGKNSRFRFCVNKFEHAVCEILNTFCAFREVSFASSWMKIYCNWTSGYVSFIWLPLFGKGISIRFFKLDFRIFNLRRPRGWFVCLVYSLPSNIFYWVLFSFYRTPEDRTKMPLNLHSWKNDLSQTNRLVFVVFLMYNFHLSLAARHLIFRRATKKLSDLFFLNGFTCASHLYFMVFSWMLSVIVLKRMEILL